MPRGRGSRPPRAGGRDRSRLNQVPHEDSDGGELNAGLVERFGRGGAFKERTGSRQPQTPLPQANVEVQKYFVKRRVGPGAPRWTSRPEVPFPEELLPYPVLPTQDFVPNTTWSNDWPTVNLNEGPNGDSSNVKGDDGGDDGDEGAAAGNASTDNLDSTEVPAADDEVDAWATESRATDAWSTRPANGDGWAPNTGKETWTPQEIGDGWADDAWIQDKAADQANDWEGESKDDPWTQPEAASQAASKPDGNSNPDDANIKADPENTSERPEPSSEAENYSQSAAQHEWNPQPPSEGGWGKDDVDAGWTAANDPGMQTTEDDDDAYESFENVGNIVDGPWPSRMDYLRSHYLLLREDALRPLRDAVEHVRSMPDLDEDPTRPSIGIYDQVQVCGVTFARKGLGIRLKFSLGRVGKNIHWAQSKRLLTGTLVVLMSPDKSKCKVATVAARPLELVNKSPPEIDVFFGRSEDFDVDCAQDWIMIEERGSFFEAQRHTLVALQRMVEEKFPLQEHLIALQTEIPPPTYVESNPIRDLRPISSREQNTQLLRDVDVLQEWPEDIHPNLDESQMAALNSILTKRLSIIQGPPGTGKTYVSVQALKVMLANMGPDDPPIIITCQTNHALDQLLGHVAKFEEKFVRVGGRSKDEDVIKKRTLFELKQNQRPPPFKWQGKWRKLEAEMEKLLEPLMKRPLGPEAKDTIDLELLRELGVLSNEQCDSVIKGAQEWVSHEQDADDKPLLKWIGKQLEPVRQRHQPMLVGYEDIDEGNIGFEEVLEQEAEQVTKDEDEGDRLGGQHWEIGDTWTGRAIDNRAARDQAKELLNTRKDLWKIRTSDRGNVYRHIQREAKARITERLRKLFPQYELACQDRKIHRYEFEETILKESKVIGLTTTGVSKYRGLIAALKPKVVLIEEAAETLEAPVIAACLESVEHLILVGDHKQLRPNCHVSALQRPPYNLNISLFERLVNNDVDYRILQKQRRMRPEIRRMLKPIYGKKITDHKSVQKIENRPLVPGMGGLATWFFTHEAPEERDQDFSSLNQFEAQMILGLVQYLHYNGVDARDITILTFYNGQRRLIKSLFAQDEKARGHAELRHVQLVTVDSYQGEENEVVILSLVRSNTDGRIGFIGIDNRVCVALSRARRGFYIFGNAQLLAGESRLWSQVILSMANDFVGTPAKSEEHATGPDVCAGLTPRRIGYTLPLWCKRHRRRFWIRSPHDWTHNVGGCDKYCGGQLPCGHRCPEYCHPWSHDLYSCKEPCKKMLPCGHRCQRECYQMPCECGKDHREANDVANGSSVQPAPGASVKNGTTAGQYHEFAKNGSASGERAMAAHLAKSEHRERVRQEQLAAARKLIDDENQRLLFHDDVQRGDDVETRLVKSEMIDDGTLRRTWEATYTSVPMDSETNGSDLKSKSLI